MANYPPTYYSQNYPQMGAYQQQMQYMPQQQMPMLSGRMVTGREEALGVQVDFNSGITVCPDLGHGVVYVKVFDRNTGTAPLLEFRRADDMPEKDDAIERMQAKLNRIMQMLEAPAGGRHVKKEAVMDD